MKTVLHFLIMLIFTPLLVEAQVGNVTPSNVIPNGNFEMWDSTKYQQPLYYEMTNNVESIYYIGSSNVTQVASIEHGSYAVQLQTLANATDTVAAVMSNATLLNGPDPATWKGGIPCTVQPTGITGYYEYNVSDRSDSAVIAVQFKKNTVVLATYIYYLSGLHTSPANFNFTFSPALTQMPDTVLLIFLSSDLIHSKNGKAGSTLILDNVSFTGVASQPSMLNGDFEQWETLSTAPKLVDWYSDPDNVTRTTDAKSGTYAVQLTTIAGSNNGNFNIFPGYITNGNWNNNKFTGGFPCVVSNDTLVFWYKYAPANPNDLANISISFKKNGTSIGGNGTTLSAASTYTLGKLPINFGGNVSDTAMIQITSSYWLGQTWADTARSYVGAVLKIDGLAFASTLATGINDQHANATITFFPNPMKETGMFHFSSDMDLSHTEIVFYNVDGTMVKKMTVPTHWLTISKADFPTGIYFYKITQQNQPIKTGKIIVE
ncbi:MAG: T9SS type A sorting domain-containing protein [Microbacter sp.]